MASENGSGASPARASRPQLTASMRSSSYLQEHQQYRPPAPAKPENHYGIDTVVEDLGGARVANGVAAPAAAIPFRGVPSPDHPPKIVESGISHELTHANCAPPPGTPPAPRLVATLFYRASKPRASNAVPASPTLGPTAVVAASDAADPASSSPEAMPDNNLAPTTDPAAFPLEPPTADLEPLDHLYGAYVSPLCIASFLHLMSTFPLPPGSSDADLTTAHRCLDRADRPRVVELTVPAPSHVPLADLRRHELVNNFEREWNVDVALQDDAVWRRHPRLVVFDMDSTLITQEAIDLLAAAAAQAPGGRPDLAARVADITRRAMLGEIAFEVAFRERVALLKGLPASVFDDLKPRLEVTEGARQLVRALRRLGARTAVLSGGFQPLADWLAAELGLDHAHANRVEIDGGGRFSGGVDGEIVGRERKRDLLEDIAHREGVAREQVVAVGDGANDLLMMAAAGLGVAWNAKPRVQMEAAARLNGSSLLDLLYLFGLTRPEVEALTA